MRRARSPIPAALAVALAAALSVGAARADGTTDPEAERLVKEGQDLLERGQIADACDKFDLSLKRAESVNTMALLAFCHERAGKPGRAWNELKRIEPRAPTGDKAAFVAQHLKALEGKVARARLDVGNRTISEVRVDNEVVVLDQGRIVADPGEHTIRVEAGGRVLSRNATMRLGDNPTIVLADPTPPAPPSPTEGDPPRAEGDGSGARIGGWVLASAGVVLLGVGIVEGVATLGIKSDADGICGGSAPTCKDPKAAADAAARRHDAVLPSWIATGGIGLGVVGLGVGILLIATSGPAAPPPPPTTGLRVTPTFGLGSVGLSGSF